MLHGFGASLESLGRRRAVCCIAPSGHRDRPQGLRLDVAARRRLQPGRAGGARLARARQARRRRRRDRRPFVGHVGRAQHGGRAARTRAARRALRRVRLRRAGRELLPVGEVPRARRAVVRPVLRRAHRGSCAARVLRRALGHRRRASIASKRRWLGLARPRRRSRRRAAITLLRCTARCPASTSRCCCCGARTIRSRRSLRPAPRQRAAERELKVYPRCGHIPMVEAHATSTRDLVKFLDSDAPGPRPLALRSGLLRSWLCGRLGAATHPAAALSPTSITAEPRIRLRAAAGRARRRPAARRGHRVDRRRAHAAPVRRAARQDRGRRARLPPRARRDALQPRSRSRARLDRQAAVPGPARRRPDARLRRPARTHRHLGVRARRRRRGARRASTGSTTSRSAARPISPAARPRRAAASVRATVVVKRAWGEALTPAGTLAVGRMGAHFGLGIAANGGDCEDCDLGDAADRVAFVSPLFGHLVAFAYDIASRGPFTRGQRRRPRDRARADRRGRAVRRSTILKVHSPAALARRVGGRHDERRVRRVLFASHARQRRARVVPADRGAGHAVHVERSRRPRLLGDRDRRLAAHHVGAHAHRGRARYINASVAQPSLDPRRGDHRAGDVEPARLRVRVGFPLGAGAARPQRRLRERRSGARLRRVPAAAARYRRRPARSTARRRTCRRIRPSTTSGSIPTITSTRSCSARSSARSPTRSMSGRTSRRRCSSVGRGHLEAGAALIASWAVCPTSTPSGQRPLGTELDPELRYASRDGFAATLDYARVLPGRRVRQPRRPPDGSYGASAPRAPGVRILMRTASRSSRSPRARST